MIEQVYETWQQSHYEFRGGRWWECIQPQCNTVNHYYIAAPGHVG